MLSTFTSYQLISRDLPRALDRVQKEPTTQRETTYYRENIGKVTSIDDLMNDDRLYRYAMKAHGLEDMIYAKAFMKKVLKEGISDSDSFANRLSDKRYADFAKTYNFEKYGAQATSYNRAQHDVPKNFSTQVQLSVLDGDYAHFGAETEYYISNIKNVTSIDGLLADDRLLTYAMAAYGLDSVTEPAATVRTMLEGGVLDPQSPANQLADKRYANFVTAFNFVENGTATTTRDVVTKEVPQKYTSGTGMSVVRLNADYIKAETDYFKANIGKMKTVTAFLADSRLLSYAMSAYGLDSSAETTRTIRTMIEGGITDPDSPANMLSDRRFANFVAAFDFAQYGDQATSRDSALKDTTALWSQKASLGWIQPTVAYLRTENAYYQANIGKVESIDDLMANKRLLDYALFAYGLDPAAQKPETVRQMLEGGVKDANSPANKLTNKNFAAFVTAFNFAENGETTTTLATALQPAIDKFTRQTLEINAGGESEGLRLALYFERKAPTIASFYSVLADPALAKVVRTILSLPDSFASADIDKQVQYFESKIKLDELTDPDKLSKLMTRFTNMWDINQQTSSQSNAATVLFAQPAEIGISTDLLFTMQRMRF
ncbi:MAG: DUF1217 domain-containing protein [Rhizobiaceae bacterium]